MMQRATKVVGKMVGGIVGAVVWSSASSSYCDARRQNVKDCEHPACASKMDLFKRAQSAYTAREETAKSPGSSDGNSSVILPSPPPTVNNCPLDREELGRSTWNLLHTLAAYYPEQPTAAEQESARQLFLALAQFYPCEVCAEDFRDSVAANPPRYDDVVDCLCVVVDVGSRALSYPDRSYLSIRLFCIVWNHGKRWCCGAVAYTTKSTRSLVFPRTPASWLTLTNDGWRENQDAGRTKKSE